MVPDNMVGLLIGRGGENITRYGQHFYCFCCDFIFIFFVGMQFKSWIPDIWCDRILDIWLFSWLITGKIKNTPDFTYFLRGAQKLHNTLQRFFYVLVDSTGTSFSKWINRWHQHSYPTKILMQHLIKLQPKLSLVLIIEYIASYCYKNLIWSVHFRALR